MAPCISASRGDVEPAGQGQPDGYGNRQDPAVGQDGRVAQAALEATGKLQRGLEPQVAAGRQGHGEAGAVEPQREVPLAQIGAEPVGRDAEQVVQNRAVILRLEVAEAVDFNSQRGGSAVASRAERAVEGGYHEGARHLDDQPCPSRAPGIGLRPEDEEGPRNGKGKGQETPRSGEGR